MAEVLTSHLSAMPDTSLRTVFETRLRQVADLDERLKAIQVRRDRLWSSAKAAGVELERRGLR